MRIFYILSFILLISLQAKSQAKLPGFADAEVKSIKFYPNPATSLITFDFQNEFDQSYTFVIFNFLGRKMIEIPTSNQKTIVNLSDFFRGIYIFQLRDPSGKIVASGKFQVIK